MKRALSVLGLLAMCGCVGPHAETLRLFASSHRSLEFHSDGDGEFGGRQHWALVDDVFISMSDDRHIHLSPPVAAVAWQKIDALDVFGWKDRYAAEDIGTHVFDGANWSLHLKVGGKEKASGGHQAYPSLADPKMTTLGYEMPSARKVRTACLALFEILQACQKEADRSPQPTTGLAPGRG